MKDVIKFDGCLDVSTGFMGAIERYSKILAQINEREGYIGEAESQAFLDDILEEPTSDH